MKESVKRETQERARWEEPKVLLVGNVKDLVRGGGKSGDALDSDPQSTEKGGVG